MPGWAGKRSTQRGRRTLPGGHARARVWSHGTGAIGFREAVEGAIYEVWSRGAAELRPLIESMFAALDAHAIRRSRVTSSTTVKNSMNSGAITRRGPMARSRIANSMSGSDGRVIAQRDNHERSVRSLIRYFAAYSRCVIPEGHQRRAMRARSSSVNRFSSMRIEIVFRPDPAGSRMNETKLYNLAS
jgi:hypothetical protein